MPRAEFTPPAHSTTPPRITQTSIPSERPPRHCNRRIGRYYFNSHRLHHAPFPKLVRQRIYEPYIAELALAESTVASYLKDLPIERIRKLTVTSPRDHVSNALRKVRAGINRGLDIVTGRAIASPDDPVR